MSERPPTQLDDIKDMLDPGKVKSRLGTLTSLPEFGWRLIRLLGELLKSVMITNDELRKLNEEIVELHKEVSEMRTELQKLNEGEDEGEGGGPGER